MGELRDRYVGMLIDRISSTRYPSSPMMDRTERAIRDRGEAENYVEALLEKIEEDRYPSPAMQDRITRLLDALD